MPFVPGFMPPKSAPLIDQWFAANGIVMGKLALHELSEGGTSIGPTSNNLTSVLNPWNVLHHAGGKPAYPPCSPYACSMAVSMSRATSPENISLCPPECMAELASILNLCNAFCPVLCDYTVQFEYKAVA